MVLHQLKCLITVFFFIRNFVNEFCTRNFKSFLFENVLFLVHIQDTVIGLQSLASYADLAFTGGVNIHLKVRTHPQRLIHSFRVSSANRLIMQEMILNAKNIPTRVHFEGRGSGCALLQVSRMEYNHILPPISVI